MNQFHRWFCRSALWKKALSGTIIPWALENVEMGANLLEIGPGPGLATDVLRQRVTNLTSIEIDPSLAAALKQRLNQTTVRVIEGDATNMPFDDRSFSGVVSFTMLHHVPSAALQDRLFSEAFRVLEPGGVFAGTDSRWSRGLKLFHLWDTLVAVEPSTLKSRLESVGFIEVSVDTMQRVFRFRARRP